MINISKGIFWDLPCTLVDGCTPCSPGCDHCWSAAMKHRFNAGLFTWPTGPQKGKFNGTIQIRPNSLAIPFKRKKPTVYAIWNDLFHESVPQRFQHDAYLVAASNKQHTFLFLTKRPHIMLELLSGMPTYPSIWNGLTICNQTESDEKIPVFLQVPGKKYLSIEPMLGPVNIMMYLFGSQRAGDPEQTDKINAIILGGETGPGARPMHPDWVRSVRDQCSTAGVPFFFKSWGKSTPPAADCIDNRRLDGLTYDDLPWHRG